MVVSVNCPGLHCAFAACMQTKAAVTTRMVTVRVGIGGAFVEFREDSLCLENRLWNRMQRRWGQKESEERHFGMGGSSYTLGRISNGG